MLVAASIVLLALLLILILKSNFLPGNVMALVPIAVALIIGTGFSNTMKFVHEGISDVLVIATLFIFATIYFGVMSDVGLFDPIINRMLRNRFIGKSVFSVVAVTALIAMVTSLDGQGVSALMITVPPMLIVFDKLKISRTLLALVFLTVLTSMNILPWAGPTARAAAVLGLEDVMILYRKMAPVQVICLISSFVVLYFASRAEQKRGFFVPAGNVQLTGQISASEETKALQRPKLFWINLSITVILIVSLFIGVPSYIAFLIACAIVLPLNYRTAKEQNARIKDHAGDLLVNVYTIVGAGALLGIMGETGMFTALATAIVSVIPSQLNSVIHIVVGLLLTPLSWLLNADAMIYGIMPVLVDVGAQYGVSPHTVASMVVVGRCLGGGLCLTTASTHLGLALMGLNFRDAFKALFKWILLLGTAMVIVTAIIVK
jgi:CitMHS family citrate-Mg2+:H+ or citrate-Ca2+:H+ symporter